jgi:predicted Zn-dependent protease
MQRAKEVFKKYLKNNPDDPEIHSLLQRVESVLEKVNKLKQAVEKMV